MKKVPLVRRSPLKRGVKGLKKTRLKPASKEKSSWLAHYRERKKLDGHFVRCASSGLLMPVHLCEPHHPLGRVKKKLMCYIWISKTAHELIHDHGKQARACGWLLKPFYGGAYDPQERRAWPAWAEQFWPEEYLRPFS